MKKNKTPYVALYPADFLADVGHLGNAELGIYWRLLLVYYRDFKPLPFDVDRLRRLAMAFSPEDQRALDEVIAQFFVLGTDNGAKCWRHNRCDREINEAMHRHQSAVDRGQRGARVRWDSSAIAEPLAELKPSQCLSNSNQNQNQNQNQKKRKTKDKAPAALVIEGVEQQVVDDWTSIRKAKKAPVTPTAIAGIRREAEKAGLSMQRALEIACNRGWAGFRAEWVEKARGTDIDFDQLIREIEQKERGG